MLLTRLTGRAMSRVRIPTVVRDARHVMAALALVGLAACSDDNGGTPIVQTPTIAITAGAATASVSPGTPATVAITLVRGGGFTGDVAVAVEGLPAGVTGVVAPTVMGSGVTTSTLTLTAGATAVAGSSNITLRGIGNNVSASTANVQLTVSIPAAIALTAGSATATAPQGGSQTIGLTVDRSGAFSGPVALVAEGLPAGVTATFAPQTLAAGVTSSTLTLNVGITAAVATTPITIRATGAGVTDKTVAVSLAVTASTTPDFTLTAAPATVALVPGASGNSVITIARSGGFAGGLTFTTSALPAGVTATFAPTPATGTTTTLSFVTTTATPVGTYNIVVSGAGTGVTTRTVTVTLNVSAAPGITVSATPTAGSAAVGGSAQSSIAITRVGGFAGDVTLAAENLPANVTASFAPAVVLAAGNSSVVTFNVGATAAIGATTINLRSTGAGGISVVTPYVLTVTAAQSFTVALAATSVTVPVGGTGSLTANITRGGGFAGAVNFTVTGLPAGITAVVNPAAATGATAAVNLTVANTVAVGQYTGTLTGAATGMPNTTTTFTVNVTTAGGGNISWAFCDATRIPVFFAYRDGSTGSWTRVTPNASNVFTFSINQSVGGVSYVLPNGTGFATTVYLQTAAEMQLTANNECASFPTGGVKTLTGTVAGVGLPTASAIPGASVAMGNASASVTFGSPNFTLNNVGAGPQDLVAVRTITTVSPTFALTPDAIIIRRGLNLASGSAITPVIDFGAGGGSVAPVSAALTVTNAGTDILAVISQFKSANGTTVSFGLPGTTASTTIYGVPTASLVAGDLHSAIISASNAPSPTSIRSSLVYFRDVVAKSVTLGPVLNLPTVTASFNSIFRPRLQGTFQAEYQTGVGASFTQSANNRAVTVSASKAYFGSSANYDLEAPDLAPVSGFQTTWGLANGFTTTYQLTATNAPSAAITDGTVISVASRLGTVPAAALRR